MLRTVLVHVDPLRSSSDRTAAAIALAQRFDATLIGITAGLPRLPVEIYNAALGTVAVGPDYTEMDRRQLEAEFGKAQAAFAAAAKGAGLETSWRAMFGPPSAAIVAAATTADIVVVGPGDRSLLGDLGAASAGDVVLRAGRPVLVVPDGVTGVATRNIVVAWKDTVEARRALADALPFMKDAESVVVLAVNEGGDTPPEIADAAAFLLRHGIAAKSEIVPTKGAATGDVVLDFAARSQADLIVAGAYGHSRVREWVFGGVTRALLMRATVPVLFSH
ncbi:MAG TPA: universal stress protein [Bauldia sp.]|nr:universal stress protein [Bauldia sp.]